jgi:HNH endonuclease/AP2 domain
VDKPKLTQARLRELLHYDPGTGEFHWRVCKRQGHQAGDIAGCRMRSEYWAIHIDGRNYRAHQLAWLYMKGEWGRPVIDHRDGNPFNNRWRNLRLASHANNAANRPRLRSNSSGFTGVSFDRRGNWMAQITKQGRRYFIGRYGSAQEAHEAYVTAARLLFGEFARTE